MFKDQSSEAARKLEICLDFLLIIKFIQFVNFSHSKISQKPLTI